MNIVKYIKNREYGIKQPWIKFKDVFPCVKNTDWRREYKIIKLGPTKKECSTCYNMHQRFIIDLHDMVDTFGFRYHNYYEPFCPYCEWYKYKH
jgi:hypothetical protein